MVAVNEKGKSEIVLRITTINGTDTITAENIKAVLFASSWPYADKIYVREVEGNSLEAEVLAVTAREIIKKHIVEPLSEIPLKMVHDIDREWQSVKDRVEKLLQHRFAQCPSCGTYAIADALHDKSKFICPSCDEKLMWKFIVDPKHPGSGRYILQK